MNNVQKRQGGAVLVLAALLIFILVGIAAFAIDMGYLYVSKSRLQNNVDAGALAGATKIFRSNTLGTFPSGTAPDGSSSWSNWVRNGASGVNDALTRNDFFNFFPGATYTVDVNGYSSFAALPMTGNPPAVRVIGNATVPLFFAPAVGGPSSVNISAQAIAITSFPLKTSPEVALVLADCAVASAWNLATNAPVLPLVTFRFNANQSPSYNGGLAACTGGNGMVWSYLSTSTAGGIPTTNLPIVGVDDYVVLNSGIVNTAWSALGACGPAPQGDGSCEYASIPVLASQNGRGFTNTDLNNGSGVRILAFACVQITKVQVSGSNSYITGNFSSGCHTAGRPGGISYYGTLIPPLLVE